MQGEFDEKAARAVLRAFAPVGFDTLARIRPWQEALPNRKEAAGARSKVSTTATAPWCALQSQSFRRNPSS